MASLKGVRKATSDVFRSVDVGYLRKWLVISILIGVVAGFGSIFFFMAIEWTTKVLMGLAGYTTPMAGGEGATVFVKAARPWVFPIVTTLGGLLSGIIVFKLAPEAEGHGTDSAIDAFHNKAGVIRKRVPPVKLIASAITIGSGGSAGREGPVAQVGAGFGSVLADIFKLDARDRRIALAAGIGAGIGSIFKAPLGGAIISAEIPYRKDFEFEALLPSFIASIIGYSIFASWHGWTPIFTMTTAPTFEHPQELFGYLVLGIACGLVGMAYGRGFYFLRDTFRKIRLPDYVKPAVGGLIVGLAGMFLPQILGTGYGWLQMAIDGNFAYLSLPILAGVIFGKILATGFTVGSGGSGGVFAPGLVVGGMLGAATWVILRNIPIGITPDDPAAFVVVGMMALFGGIAKAPLAVMIMVSEMTHSYELLAPCMVSVVIAYFLTGRNHIYEKQVDTRIDSPAHRAELSFPLLRRHTVREHMKTKIVFTTSNASVSEVVNLMRTKRVGALPVVDNGDMVGIIANLDIVPIPSDKWPTTFVHEVMTKHLVVGYQDESLYHALAKMTSHNISHLPIVQREDEDSIVGILTLNDISLAYTIDGIGG